MHVFNVLTHVTEPGAHRYLGALKDVTKLPFLVWVQSVTPGGALGPVWVPAEGLREADREVGIHLSLPEPIHECYGYIKGLATSYKTLQDLQSW